MARYSIQEIARIINGSFLCEGENTVVEHLLTDSRKLIFPQNSLFFALISGTRNGHSFIKDLYERGVRNFVVSEMQAQPGFDGANLVLVKDTLLALQQLAAWHRKQFAIPVIGITGSNGKTIVKEWLNQLLQHAYQVVRSPKSYNSQIGVPLSIWLMDKQHELGIFEAGISMASEMQRLETVIHPTIGILTNIGHAHDEGFHNFEEKTAEKVKLFKNCKTVIYCKDYEGVQNAMNQLKGIEHFDWSNHSKARLTIQRIEREAQHTRITALYDDREIKIRIPFSDDASVENAIHCWCVLLHLGLPDKSIQNGMEHLTPVAMRLEFKKGLNGCLVINDAYSSDLNSLAIALDFLARQKQHARHTVILSDILQSGQSQAELYAQVAASLHQRKISRLIGIGENISHHRAIFKEYSSLVASFYTTVAEFIKDFNHQHFHDETILLKGARAFELEQISKLLEQKVHQTILEIDINAMVHNLKQYRQLLQPGTKLMAMVKAFAYGSGSAEIASILQFHKVDYLAVAYADEGVELRKAGIHLPIMVMNPDASAFDTMVQHSLEPELFSIGQMLAFESFLQQEGIPQYPVHLELETGMNRLGFSEADLPKLKSILSNGIFKVQSIFSHLVASEDPNLDEFTRQQSALFQSMSRQVQEVLPYTVIRHIANSAAISRHPLLQFDMVRLGIGLYGIGAVSSARQALQEVSTLKSTIAQVKKLHKGETVGYGRAGIIEKDSVIATVRIGYADGYPRSLGNGAGKMYIRGRMAPVSGIVCMDMTMIDVTGIAGVEEGDEVIVFGKQLPVQQVASWARTIPYEILTGISQRVKRVYFEE